MKKINENINKKMNEEDKMQENKKSNIKTKKVKTPLFFKISFAIKFIIFLAICGLAFYFYQEGKKLKDKVETIYELRCIVKNLKAQYPVAKIEVTENTETEVKFTISYYKQNGELFSDPDKIQRCSISGNTIYLDCYTYNFAFSLIETGEVKNFAIPFRIYSDKTAPKDGLALRNTDKKGIPLVLYDESYFTDRLARDLQKKRLSKFMNVINNPKKAEELGILRSLQKNAIGNTVDLNEGDIYIISVEQSGGISMKKAGWLFKITH